MTPAATPAISAVGLRKSFKGTTVLDGVDLDVPTGTLLALLGPNGAGKTTAVRILSTLLRPDSGRVEIQGWDLSAHPEEVRRRIGVTGQHATVDDLLTGVENLVMLARLQGLPKAAARERAAELLRQFELTEAARRRVATYSGGMRRRLDLAASLIAAPPVVFLDEPTVGLDPRSRRELWTMIRRLLDAEVTVLLTTQYLEEADQLADRVAVIDSGRVVASGAPAELKRKIGAERLDLRFDDSAAAEAAAAALRPEFSGRPGATREPGLLRLPAAGPAQIREALNRLEAAGVPPRALSVSEPTLDDVFFQLTEPTPTEGALR